MWWDAIHSEQKGPGQPRLREPNQLQSAQAEKTCDEPPRRLAKHSTKRARIERLTQRLIEERLVSDEHWVTQLAAAEREIQLSRSHTASLAGELKRLRAERTDLQTRVELLTQHTSELQQQLVNKETFARNELEQHVRVVGELEQCADQQTVEREHLERRVEQLGLDADQFLSQLVTANHEIELRRAHETALVDELDRLRASWLERQELVERLTSDTESLRQQLVDRELHAEDETQHHARIVAELQQNVVRQSVQQEHLERRVEQLGLDADQLVSQLATANHEIESRRAHETALVDELDRLRASWLERQELVERLTSDTESLRQQLAERELRAEDETQHHARIVAELEQDVARQSVERGQFEQLAEKLRLRGEELLRQLAAEQQEARSWQTKEEALSVEVRRLHATGSEQQNHLERVAQENESLKRQLSAGEQHAEHQAQRHAASLAELELRCEDLSVECQCRQSKAEKDRGQFTAAVNELAIARHEIESFQRRQAGIAAELDDVRAEHEAQRHRADQASEQLSSLQQACEDYETQLARDAARQAELAAEMQRVRALFAAESDGLLTRLRGADETIRHMARELDDTVGQLRQSQKIAACTTDELKGCRLRAATEAENAATREEKLHSKCDQLVVEIEQLQNSLKQQFEATATAAAERADLQMLAARQDETARQAASELAVARQEIDALAKREGELAGHLADLQATRDAEQVTRSHQAELIFTLSQQLSELEARIAEASRNLVEAQTELQFEIQRHQQESEKLRRESLDRSRDGWNDERQHLLEQLQREAAARHKAESALRREVAQPDCPPQVRNILSQIDSERLVPRLQRELVAEKNFRKLLMQRAGQRIDGLQREISRLKQDLAEAKNRDAAA